MSDNKKKILEMLAENKISADEAYRLLTALDTREEGQKDTSGENQPKSETGVKGKAKYLRVLVTPGEKHTDPGHTDRVNVRVPMSLIRAGIKLTALIPPEALDKANNALKEKGINFDVRNIKNEDIEDLIDAMGDMQVDVETAHGENVKVFVE
jgi:hypothetical protein